MLQCRSKTVHIIVYVCDILLKIHSITAKGSQPRSLDVSLPYAQNMPRVSGQVVVISHYLVYDG